VTSRINFELDAASEVWHALRVLKICENADVFLIKRKREWIRGLIAIVFDYDSILASKMIYKYFLEKPWIMEFSEKIIPVEFVSNDINEVASWVLETAKKRISSESKWKVEIYKHSAMHKTLHVIEKVTKDINWGKVDLTNPDWIIHIDIIKRTLAASIIKPNTIIRKKIIKQKLMKKKLTL